MYVAYIPRRTQLHENFLYHIYIYTKKAEKNNHGNISVLPPTQVNCLLSSYSTLILSFNLICYEKKG